MACVTEGVVKRYEDGTLESSRPNGASSSSLIKRLDLFYEWMANIPRGGELKMGMDTYGHGNCLVCGHYHEKNECTK